MPFLPSPSSWPFAPGQGPFRIKGTAYRGHLEYVAEHVPGGVEAMRAQLTPDLSRFFEQPFLAASLYDVHPLVVAAAPCAQALGISDEAFVAQRSRHQAPKDLTGVYRFLLAMVPTRTVAKRMPQLFTQILDFGLPTVTRDEAGIVDARIDGMPVAIAPWFGAVIAAYGEAALTTSGAERAVVRTSIGAPTGVEHGVAVASIDISVRWG